MIELPWPMTRAKARELKLVVIYADSLLDSWEQQAAIFKGFNHTVGLPTVRCWKLSPEERYFKLQDKPWYIGKAKSILEKAISKSISLGFPMIMVPDLFTHLPEEIKEVIELDFNVMCDKVKWIKV